MKPLKEMHIVPFQLNRLFNEQERKVFNSTLKHSLFCFRCMDVCRMGLIDATLRLDIWNNILVVGKCAKCRNMVYRAIEYGKDPFFYQKALEFRKSIQN
jgi:hypothetical protein